MEIVHDPVLEDLFYWLMNCLDCPESGHGTLLRIRARASRLCSSLIQTKAR